MRFGYENFKKKLKKKKKTHNQRQKTLKVASVLSLIILPHFKDQFVARMQLWPVKFPVATGHSTRCVLFSYANASFCSNKFA